MSSVDIEVLLRSLVGPSPSPGTTGAVMVAARRALDAHAQARPQRRRRLVLWGGLTTTACVGLALAVALWVRPQPASTSEGLGTVAAGPIEVRRGAEQLALAAGDVLYPGDLLAPTKRADVRLADGASIALDAGARLLLHPLIEGERARLALSAGRIFLRVPAGGAGRFLVEGSAAVEVTGTIFGVREMGTETSVSVFDGQVTLRSGGASVDLGRGQSGAGGESVKPHRTDVDPGKALLWAREPVVFADQPLADVLDWIEANSSFRFGLDPQLLSTHTVTVTVSNEPMRQVIDAVLLACGLDYRIDDWTVVTDQ
jgi:ferric-dicitrate binding protein FerR (iron transport regulator)